MLFTCPEAVEGGYVTWVEGHRVKQLPFKIKSSRSRAGNYNHAIVVNTD